MSIKQYTNFENIDSKSENEGKYISEKDFGVISKNKYEQIDFGECKYDVMEVSVYDINNNILQQEGGKSVAYIRSDNIRQYLYQITKPNAAVGDGGSTKELAIDIEKLLNDLGFTNGILRVNINFVRNRVGTENELRRVWIQEISPTRSEIRVLPLSTADDKLDMLTEKEMDNLKNLSKDFKYYKESILNSLTSFKNTFLDDINTTLETKYGTDYFTTLRKDFGLEKFSYFRDKIYSDFITSVDYYLSNKSYDIMQPDYGKKSSVRFEACEQYDFNTITSEFGTILYKCIDYNLSFLKRRDLGLQSTSQEFKAVDITPNVKNVFNVMPPEQIGTMVFQPERFEIEPTYPDQPLVVQLASETTPAPPPIVPTQVPVASKDTYQYVVKNLSSTRSLKVTYVTATGETATKTLSAGRPAKLCARENTISADFVTTATIPLPNDTSIKKSKFNNIEDGSSINLIKSGQPFTKDYEIQKYGPCGFVELGTDLVLDTPVKNLQPPVRPINEPPLPPRSTMGGGGITREEAAASTNQIITPRGTAISTATAAGMSEGLSALQPVVRTDVRQTSITGPIID